MRTLLIDNYDSYTFNLFQLLGEVNGEEPLVIYNDELPWRDVARWDFDNVVISPGPGRPEHPRDVGMSLDALGGARVPVLGVCLGHQGLGYALGGVVGHAPEVMHGRLSPVLHDGEGLFEGIPQGFSAVRYHSLVVQTVPAELRVTAWTKDGVVMGLAHESRSLLGVQFHPESIATEHGRRLLENFRDLTPTAPTWPRTARRRFVPAGRRVRPADVGVRHRRVDGWVDPEAAFCALYGERECAFWLDSAQTGAGTARFSYMGAPEGPLGQVTRHDVGDRESVFDWCERELARLRCDAPELPFDFVGGLVGYFGYELKAECGARRAHRSPIPDAALILCDRLLAFDHAERCLYLVAIARRGDEAEADAWLTNTEAALGAVQPPPPPGPIADEPIELTLHDAPAAYLASIAECKRQIFEGESYEICLTTEITSPARIDPLAAYRALRARNPAPHAAFLRLGDLSVLSSSPERFLRVARDRTVESRPIKGTTPADHDPEELRTGEKFRAENLMIVDLVRNDLGRVCEIGSVHVPALMAVETYPTVHQLVSTIRGTCRPGVTALDCVKAAFPGGSMTGAPKLRTMEIIDDLERRPRGVYSGALGFLGLNGTADLSIVIRTLVAAEHGLSIGAGGAIVAGSDPEEELEEMLLKARALIEAVGGRLIGAETVASERSS
jgi:para-aminobenzoate synthetase